MYTPSLGVGQARLTRRSLFAFLFLLIFAGSVLGGCNRTPSELVGQWRDVSVDAPGGKPLSEAEKEQLRHKLTLNSGGTGTYATGGKESTEYSINWSVAGKYLTLKDSKGDKEATFTLSEDRNELNTDGTKSKFSGDVVSFVKNGGSQAAPK